MQVVTQLMFTGAAEEAMTFYVSLFPGSRIVSIERYGPSEEGRGSVKRALFELGGSKYAAIDSTVQHPFTFTPAMSIFVDCDTRQQLERAYEALSAGGSIFMPPASYGFSTWFAWVQDRFGVSWQLNLQ
jgi:predicted 3-demethylubiquinone-9 3-methyltransferase (glyoxalase superfamily)